MDRTDDYSTEHISGDYYRQLVQLRLEANKLLTKLQFEEDPRVQKRFKKTVSLLAKEMEPKYQRRTDVEKPEELEKDEIMLQDISVNQGQSLLASFRDLQEKLGITSMARNEYELDEKGVKKKE